MMKRLIQLEELFLFGACIYALQLLKADWWFYVLLMIGPDISMLGYLAGNKTGAFMYNLFHHKALAVALFCTGIYTEVWLAQVIGIILFGHSSLDRIFGYGLKYRQGFQHTHLGLIGSAKNKNISDLN